MQLSTKYFGLIDCDREDILFFPTGLFGFEEETQFILLPFEGSEGTLLSLQSIQTPELSFIALNPFSLMPEYAPELQRDELRVMEVSTSQELCFYVLCAVKNPVSDSTVNLKCPIAINDHTRKAMQVILENSQYEMRHLLAGFQRKEVLGAC